MKKEASTKFSKLCGRLLAYEIIGCAISPLHVGTASDINYTLVQWFGDEVNDADNLFIVTIATAAANCGIINDLLCLGLKSNIMPRMIQYMQELGLTIIWRWKSVPVYKCVISLMVYFIKLISVIIFRKLYAENLLMSSTRSLICYPMSASYITSHTQYHNFIGSFLNLSLIPKNRSIILSPLILESKF